MHIKDKTIVLTGASGGIGQAIAHKLSAQKAKLILVGRNSEKLSSLNQKLGNLHHTASVDLSTQEGRHELVNLCSKIGNINVLINNAGISQFSSFESISEEQLGNVINTNLLSPMLLTKSLLPLLANSQQSYILNVGSAFGSIGYPCFTSYCASKFGLRGFTEALKRELQDSNTKVMYIAPRATNTPINSDAVNQLNHDLGNKTDSPEVVANAVLKQLEKGLSQVAIGWPEKLFSKINGVFPSLVDNAIAKQLQQIKKFAMQKN